jgi:predicted permease
MQTNLFAQTILPVFFVLGLGFYAGKRGRVGNQHPEALIAVLMHFALPCSLLLGIGSAPAALLRSQVPLLGVLVCAMLATYGVAYALARRDGNEGAAAVRALTVGFANNVAIGFPFLMHYAGAQGQLAAMCGIIAGALVLSPITLVLLELAVPSEAIAALSPGARVWHAVRVSMKRPVILAPAVGLVLTLSGHPVPPVFASSLDVMAKVTIGLALFLTGLILSAQPFRLTGAVMTGVALKNFVQPALLFALLPLFALHGQLAREAFLLAAVPAGFFGTVFGARFRVASVEASSILVLSTLLAAATLPLAVMLAAKIP